MDFDFEEKIAQAYMAKNKRVRFIFERKKDPMGAIVSMHSRFIERLKFNYSTQYNSPDTIWRTLGIESSDTICYTITECSDVDGLHLPFDKIIPYVLQNGHGTLIVYPPTGIAYFIDESWASLQPNYYLKADAPLVHKRA